LVVAGVDGCRGGWLVVIAVWSDRGAIEAIEVMPDFAAVLALTSGCEAVAVDIPIGLCDGKRREADGLARGLLAPRKTSSVFPAPPRAALAATSYAEACRLSQASVGKSMSHQAYYILDKVRDADSVMTPALQQRVFESHPEVTFRALNRSQPVLSKKRSAAGRADRAALLSPLLGADPFWPALPRLAARDDLHDASVLTWTAQRAVSGDAVHLPYRAEYDARGLRMEIVY
jgi:predicted RNase H-like nuclease